MSQREASADAALNAVLGDYLERRGNALSIQMSFYEAGRPLALTAASLAATGAPLTRRVAVLVHGMAQTEACWAFPGNRAVSYGSLLRDDFGITPFYVRYNSGLHVSENGRKLALLLEELLSAYPLPVDELTLIGHSMGGLLIRSACHYAALQSQGWLGHTRRAFYLGSPHLGSPFEKAGHLASLVLGAIDHPIVRLTGKLGNLRSAGVKDLRHGSILDEDWQGRNLDGLDATRPEPVPLAAGIDHYVVAGALNRSEKHLMTQLFGDALVRLESATAPARQAHLAPDHVAIVPGVLHMTLSHHADVYAKIQSWMAESLPLTAPTGAPGVTPGPTVGAVDNAAPADNQARSDERADRNDTLDRLDAYRALLEDAIEQGATAVQEVQKDLTRKPYAWARQVPPLAPTTSLVESTHLAVLDGVYATLRRVNALTSATLHEGLAWLKKR